MHPYLARHHFLVCLSVFLISLGASSSVLAQRAGAGTDDQLVSRSSPVVSGELVELYQEGMVVDPAFLATLESAYRRIEKLLGGPHDKATLGDKIRVYVTGSKVVSHVWHGYEHRRDPRGILFLNRGAYAGGMRAQNATYAHELTHLFTWRFHSHTLREGLADYIALEILPGAVVGPNVNGYDWSGKLPQEVLDLLGTTTSPPPGVVDDIRLRQAYYFGSYRLVKLLVDKGGLPKFMQLYAAADPETAFVELYGMSRMQIVQSLNP